MPTIAEKLAVAITNQLAEVDRLRAQVENDLPRAQARLDALLGLQRKLTPALEAAYVTLKSHGIRLDD